MILNCVIANRSFLNHGVYLRWRDLPRGQVLAAVPMVVMTQGFSSASSTCPSNRRVQARKASGASTGLRSLLTKEWMV